MAVAAVPVAAEVPVSLLPGDDAAAVAMMRIEQSDRIGECWSCRGLSTLTLVFEGDEWRHTVPVCEDCFSVFKVTVCRGTVTAHARRTDPDTSKQAARSVNVTQGQERVLGVIREAFPLAMFTLDDLLVAARDRLGENMTPSGVRSRCAELVEQGRVLRAGTTKLPSGRSAMLHRLVTV